jgi:hypothetical protein
MFFTGCRVKTGHFSRDNTEALVSDYVENTKKLSERRWNRILERCGAVPVAENEPCMESVCMDERRRVLYVPSSPAPSKGSDEE